MDQFTPMPTKGLKSQNSAAPAADNVGALVAAASAATPALTEGNQVLLSVDTAGRLRVILDGGSGGVAQVVDVTDRAARLLGVASLDTATINALTTALESVDLNVATRDDIVARLTTAIQDMRDVLSTNLESVSLNAATVTEVKKPTLQVAGADVTKHNPLPVTVSKATPDQNSTNGTTASVASGASAVIGTGPVASLSELVEVTASASVRLKAEIIAFNGETEYVHRTFFVEAYDQLVYKAPDDAVKVVKSAAVGATDPMWRVRLTNMDNLNAADVHASIVYTSAL